MISVSFGLVTTSVLSGFEKTSLPGWLVKSDKINKYKCNVYFYLTAVPHISFGIDIASFPER